MKPYTDIEQSKILAEFLPIESADGFYEAQLNPTTDKWEYILFADNKWASEEVVIPCWSLAALLDILRNRAYSIDEDAIVTLSSYKTFEWDLSISNSGLNLVTESDPIDACVEMIFKLHEEKLL